MARYGTVIEYSVYTRLWLRGIEWFLNVINYNHCQKSKWMTCLQRSVQSSKGGIRGTEEGERLYFLVFLVTFDHTQYYGNGHPIHLKWPQYRSCCATIDFFFRVELRIRNSGVV